MSHQSRHQKACVVFQTGPTKIRYSRHAYRTGPTKNGCVKLNRLHMYQGSPLLPIFRVLLGILHCHPSASQGHMCLTSSAKDSNIERKLSSRGDQRVLRWFGHLKRMAAHRMARRVLMAEVSVGRVRERPRLGWMDSVKVAVGNRRMTVEAVAYMVWVWASRENGRVAYG